MCGATQEQKTLESKQAAFYDTMTQQYKEVFGKSQGILDALTKTFMPILNAGPGQKGFSTEERQTLDTTATETTAANFADAKRKLNEELAASGGTDFIPSGEEAQLQQGLVATEAADRTSLENQIEEADFATGRQQWQAAASVLGGVASEQNPQGFANATTNAGSAAGTTANQIAQASNSIWGSVIGGLSGIAGSAVTGWTTPKPAATGSH